MFEKLFTYAAVLKRHREGPLARERATYLERLASQGMARETLLWRARYSLYVARGLARWPVEYRFVESDIEKLATAWATTRVAQGMEGTNRYAEVDLEMKAKALETRAVSISDCDRNPRWRKDKDLMAFLSPL